MAEHFSKVEDLLRLEASAVERAADNLDREAANGAVMLIADCKSKVVVMGVGKSGVIAQKIAQTMTSSLP